MDIEFKPKFSNFKSKLKALRDIITGSIKDKLQDELNAMSQEELVDNHYLPITPDIPKTKKGIEKALDEFISSFTPLEDKGEELLSYLGYYDNEPPYNETPLYKKLHKEIKSKVNGNELDILTEPKKVIEIVRALLLDLPVIELYELNVFGVVVTENEAKSNRELFLDKADWIYQSKLLFYAKGSFLVIMAKQELKPKDAITYSAQKECEIHKQASDGYRSGKTGEEELNEWREIVKKVIDKYPNEAQAYCRGYVMAYNNYSERAILSTVNKILSNGNTGD
jgi:hypothetical protein